MKPASDTRFCSTKWGVLGLICLLLVGCGGPVTKLETSAAVHQWAKLRTACSSQNTEMLERTGESIAAAFEAGEITEREHAEFQKILQTAREGRWAEAEKQCQRLHAISL